MKDKGSALDKYPHHAVDGHGAFRSCPSFEKIKSLLLVICDSHAQPFKSIITVFLCSSIIAHSQINKSAACGHDAFEISF